MTPLARELVTLKYEFAQTSEAAQFSGDGTCKGKHANHNQIMINCTRFATFEAKTGLNIHETTTQPVNWFPPKFSTVSFTSAPTPAGIWPATTSMPCTSNYAPGQFHKDSNSIRDLTHQSTR